MRLKPYVVLYYMACQRSVWVAEKGKKLNRAKGIYGDYTSNPWQTTLLGLGRGFSASQVSAFAV